MNSQDIRNLQEAYFDVYQNLDERVLGQDPESRKEDSKERKSGIKRLSPSSGEKYAKTQSQLISFMDKFTKNKKIIPGMANEEVEEFDEGKVPWDDSNRPLQSGHTPAEKNRAKRARTGVEDPNKSQMDISDRSMSRYGGMKTADDTETSKAPKQKKTLLGKKKPLEHETPPHEFKKDRKLDLKQTGNEYSMNQHSSGKGNATRGQARRAVGANFAGYRDGDSSIFPTPIKQGDTRKRTSKKWGGPNPRTRKENVDLYDVIFSHLLDEAEGSYGQTPKATAAYIALATRKGRKGSTKSKALAHAIRSSTRQPITTPSHRSNMTPSDRTYYRGQDENRGGDREPIDFGRDSEGINFDDNDTGPSGPGGMPKGKKLKRQRIRGISASYEPDLYDVILEYLLDEGYADTNENALVIMANMSEEWRESICEV